MGRAVVERIREDTTSASRPKVVYFGLLFEKEGKDAEQALQEKVYTSWDRDPTSPPTNRARDPIPEPTLQILGWQGQLPFFPDSLAQKFATGTAAHKKVMELKAELDIVFPGAAGSQTQASGGRASALPRRAAGRPDYSIEGGLQPVDPAAAVDLPVIPAANFSEPRPGCLPT